MSVQAAMTVTRLSVLDRTDEQIIFPTISAKGGPIAVAPLQTVSLAKVEAKDASELERLRQAANYPGFFYLQLEQHQVKAVTDLEPPLIQFFARSFEAKMLDRPSYRPGKAEIYHIKSSVSEDWYSTLSSSLKSHTQKIQQILRTSESIAKSLSDGLSIKTRQVSTMKLINVSGACPKDVSCGRGISLLLSSGHESDACTASIHLAGSGLGGEHDWATVIPKDECILVGVSGASHRIAEPLPGEEQQRSWIEVEVE